MLEIATALAPAGLAREFEADVTARLKQSRATLHGCPVEAVECKIDGAIVVWFAGMRDGVAWRGALRFSFPWLHQRKFLADSSAVSDVALRLLERLAVPAGERARLIQRAAN
jgi:hypothetical protein